MPPTTGPKAMRSTKASASSCDVAGDRYGRCVVPSPTHGGKPVKAEVMGSRPAWPGGTVFHEHTADRRGWRGPLRRPPMASGSISATTNQCTARAKNTGPPISARSERVRQAVTSAVLERRIYCEEFRIVRPRWRHPVGSRTAAAPSRTRLAQRWRSWGRSPISPRPMPALKGWPTSGAGGRCQRTRGRADSAGRWHGRLGLRGRDGPGHLRRRGSCARTIAATALFSHEQDCRRQRQQRCQFGVELAHLQARGKVQVDAAPLAARTRLALSGVSRPVLVPVFS